MTNVKNKGLGTVMKILAKDETAKSGVQEFSLWSEQFKNYEDLWTWLNTLIKTNRFKAIHSVNDYFSIEFNRDKILYFSEIDYLNKKPTSRSKN